MSSSTASQTPSAPPSGLNSILDTALSEYKKTTGRGLLEHPLAAEVKRCDSIGAISAILQGQAREFQQFRDGDQRLMKWINPMVDVLSTFSQTLGGVASVAFPPAGAVFTGIGVLLSAAKDVSASHNALVELFERIESFFKRLGVYTQVSLTAEMAEVFVKIVAEVLSILSIATKEVKRKRAKIYFRKLLGRTDIEDAFKRLDSLIWEEVRMVIAQTWKATIEHKEDSSKANVDIAGNIGEVAKNTEELAKKGDGIEKNTHEIAHNTNEIANNMEKIQWKQIEQDILKWFSPPDPSTNHNTACDVYNNVPPTWFFRASVFEDWMSKGSLLWVHGKPGSGKSIFCSAIIQYIMKLSDAGNATLAYFYFDFRDEQKQNVRDVVTSLLVQLSTYSKPCCGILYRLYSTQGKGMQHRQPSARHLIDCLKEMLAAVAQHPIFIFMDALDECPDLGLPTPREAVLGLVKDLVCLHLQVPNLHIFVTSRPEVDIQTRLKPLAVSAISLQDERRQKAVISNYVSSVMSSDEQMKQWRDEDKRLVAKELSERADGMFQWVFCQIETLRHAVQPNVRRILEKLPKTLDETYERVLRNINENNQEHARRLLHCLAVSVRPLRVEELAEILSFDFDAAEGCIPKFHPDRRPRNPEHAILSICSSLIAIVGNQGSRVVQFSHLSVKEFLTSSHLVSSTGHLNSYHILPKPAHTILTQACLGLLLQSNTGSHDKSVGVSPLSEYAARHWVTHAQFEDVASRVMDGIESLFDPDKAHFAAWIDLYNMDTESGRDLPPERPSPLYYSALCGLHGLVRHVAVKHPQHINAIGGSYGFPIVAALCRNHFPVAELLLELGGRVDVRDMRKQTVLHKTIDRHDKGASGAVKFLLEHGADVNAKRDDLWTPLHLAFHVGKLNAARILLEHHADVNARTDDGQVPLHLLSRWEAQQGEDDGSDLARQLLERCANVNEKDKDNATPLHLASYYKRLEIARVLLDRGANINMENAQGKTPLQIAIMGSGHAQYSGVGVARLLLAHGAEAYVQDKYPISTSDLACCFHKEKVAQVLLGNGDPFTPESSWDETFRSWMEECGVDENVPDMYETILLHSASYQGTPEMVELLLDHGVKLNAKNHWGETVLHVVSRGRQDSQSGARVAELLLERGVDVNTRRTEKITPLHVASCFGKLEIVRLLLDHGADANAETEDGLKLLHQVSLGLYEFQEDGLRVAELLLEHGADVDTRDKNHWTPLHFSSRYGKLEIVRLLLDHGAEVNAEAVNGEEPLHKVSYGENRCQEDGVRVARLLLERGADVNTRCNDHLTPLHVASYFGNVEIVCLLLDHGADLEANAEGDYGAKPLHSLSCGKFKYKEDGVHVAQLLLERGADVNIRSSDHRTPLHFASLWGKLDIVQLLIHSGAEVNAVDDFGQTPLHDVSQGKYESQEDGVRVAQLLLDHGTDVNATSKAGYTPLDLASRTERPKLAELLLEHAADVNAQKRSANSNQLGH